MRYLLLVLFFLIPFRGLALDRSQVHWFREYGVGFEIGAAFQENTTGEGFTPMIALGPEIYVGVFRYMFHRVYLNAGYVYLDQEQEFGTKQVQVKTLYQRVDLTAGYDFSYKLLITGLHLGSAMMIVKSHTTVNNVSGFAVSEEEIDYTVGKTIDEIEATGVNFGFLGSLNVGLDFARPILGIDHVFSLLEIRAKGDYIRQRERDTFFVGAVIIFWPSAFLN